MRLSSSVALVIVSAFTAALAAPIADGMITRGDMVAREADPQNSRDWRREVRPAPQGSRDWRREAEAQNSRDWKRETKPSVRSSESETEATSPVQSWKREAGLPQGWRREAGPPTQGWRREAGPPTQGWRRKAEPGPPNQSW